MGTKKIRYRYSSRHFFYDFDQEKKIAHWSLVEEKGEYYTFETVLELEEPMDAVILFDTLRQNYTPSCFLSLSLRTEERVFAPEDSEIAYVSLSYGVRYAFRCALQKGPQKLFVTVRCLEKVTADRIECALIPDFPMPEKRVPQVDAFHRIPAKNYPETPAETVPADYTPGTGREFTPGHFGFSKGDGILDCSMPMLGIVDKLFVSGNPRYRKPWKWTLSLLPEGLCKDSMYHGTYPPSQINPKQDEVEVNHLSVKWSALFPCENGSRTRFSCRYSMASPLIMAESDRAQMSLSLLEYAGNYHYMMFAGKGGICVRNLQEGDFPGPAMTENWILLFGTDEYPDIPVLLVFADPVKRYSVRCYRGRLSKILFEGPSRLFCGTPFGIECFDPRSPEDAMFLRDAVRRARFWSRAALAWPKHCKEYFRNDPEKEKVRIVQKFEYEITQDFWNTRPLKLAPFPTVTSLAGTVDFLQEPEDYRFPTKFGYLQGVIGSGVSSYEIPFMPRGRRYPLPEGENDAIRKHLKKGLEEYFQFQEQFPPGLCGYGYTGSVLEPYAWTSSMFLFLDEADRTRLRRHVSERIRCVCDPDFQSRYPMIDWSWMMEHCPEREALVKMIHSPEQVFASRFNSYSRKEPFTGKRITYCYSNPFFYSNGWLHGPREEFEKFDRIPNMIENDWGVGMTLYYLYLSCLAAGDFEPVRKDWQDLRNVWSFFDLLCDWALMGSGYADDGQRWVEGGNYGGYTAFVNLAEAIGERADMEYGIYLAAKHLVLRMAWLKAGQHFFYKYFGVEPYGWIWGFNEEKSSISLFNFVPPAMTEDRYLPNSLGNFTTEGMFPETYETLAKLAPEELRKARKYAYAVMRDPNVEKHEYWGYHQQSACLLQSVILDENYPVELAEAELFEAEKGPEIIRQWRGIHVFSRNLPENYFSAQMRAYLQGRSQPMHLEHWSGLVLQHAEYIRKERKACVTFLLNGGKPGFLRVRVRQEPLQIVLDGRELSFHVQGNKIELSLEQSGTLEFRFGEKKSQA